jgi:hypothetical protein
MTTMNTSPAVRLGTTAERLGVPWGTVLPLAVVAAFGNGFWLVAMRGAAGAIERTSHQFTVWLQESTLLLPLYVFAVLAAVTLAMRRFGPGPLRHRTVVATLVLVVLASTLAASVVQAAEAVYDYRLQTEHVVTMAADNPTCDTECVSDRQESALLLQVRALGLNGSVMLVSNLVLLGLVVAFRGGRLDVVSRQRDGVASHPPSRGRPGDSRGFLAVCLFGTAAIHAAVAPRHLTEWPAAGVFFIGLSAVEMALAVLVLVGLRPGALRAIAVLSTGTVMLWLDSVTDGLPFGPGTGVAPPVGLADGAATLLEIATLVVALAVLKLRGWPLRPWTPPHREGLAVVAVVAIAFIGVAVGLEMTGGGQQTQPHHGHYATA